MARFRFHSMAFLASVFLLLGQAGNVPAAPQAVTPPDQEQGISVAPPRLRIVLGLEEPLVATGPTTAREDADLDAAIATFRNPATPAADFTDSARPFTEFLAAHPGSAWRLAILTNLGLGYYHAGYFTRATTAWEEAWAAGREAATPQAKALADRAIGELARMHARVGHAEELEKIFADLGSRPISGPATELITGAWEGLWLFRNEPETSYLCGPKALQNLLTALKAPAAQIGLMDEARSGPRGFSLAQVAELADRAGLAHRLIYRTPGQAIPVPSVVNWKMHHYAAIVGEQDGRYHIKDPTFGSGDLWVSKTAIDEEMSGYFLVPASAPPDTAWRAASATEARQVYGMGQTNQSQSGSTTCKDQNKTAETGTAKTAMCMADAKAMLVSLSLEDAPVGYDPPKGPSARITLTYNQREANQPAVFGFFNVSPKWTLNVLSWVQDNPSSPGQSVLRYVAGGGSINYASGYSFNAATGAFSPERQGQAILVRIPASGAATSYELRMPDGSKQVFAHADGAATAPRRIFLTQIVDPAGNALTFEYDSQLRLTAITDATGRDTTFSYGTANPLLVTAITDPFGRHAELTYDASGRLDSITDVIGITSSFTYDAGGLVNTMTTPYGTSTFVYGQNQAGTNSRFLETTDPMGFTDRLEFRHLAPGIAATDPTPPSGLTRLSNAFLQYRNTFYWDQHIYPITHTDYTKARLTHWLHNPANQTSPIVESSKEPLERRVWRTYPGQTSSLREGTAGTPTAIARVLDDGTTQASKFTYNAVGKPLTAADPLGRKTVFTYDPSGIDLLTIQQQTASSGTLSTIAAFTYNSQHLPLTYTDAAGQTTTFTYNSAGQVLTATNTLSETTRYEYDGLGYLTRVVNANNATAASFTYDGFGRVATRTDSEGHTVSFEYDELDRVTKVSYPDGTNRSYAWDKLDLASVTDRLTRTTRYVHDANRRLTSVTDPLGRTTQYGYYENGVLRSITDPNGNTTSWDIDIQSRPTSKHYADGTADTYTYEATTSRLKSIQDAEGQLRQYGYAGDNRLLALDYAGALNPTPSVRFAYDPFFPRVTSMSDGNGTTTYQYKPIGAPGALRLAQEDGPFQNDAILYDYDALGRIANRSVGGSAETFTYDALSRLSGSTNDLGPLTYGYLGETGQLTGLQLGAAVSSSWTYDTNANDRRLKSINHSGATRSYQFSTDPESIINGITETAGAGSAFPPQAWTYEYDDADRLREAQASSGQFAYDLDPADNLTRIATPTGTKVLAYDEVNQIEQADGTPFVYDANGNLTDDGIRTYKWDAENRLAEIGYKDVPGKKTVFRYNGYGLRTAIIETGGTGTTETRYLWCGDNLCQARSTSDAVSRRYFAEGEVWPQAATKLYYAQDHLGSVRDLLVAQTGSRAAAYDYEPYGKPSQGAGRISVDFRYAGMFYHQASGLYLTNYRAYDPVTARWLSRDPIEEAGGLNLYSYVGGSPVNYIDPVGDCGPACVVVARAIIGAGVGAAADLFWQHRRHPGCTDWAEVFDVAIAVAQVAVGGPAAASSVAKEAARQAERTAAKAVAKKTPEITKAYKRPSGATTAEQRASVQGKPCVDCGNVTPKQVADHKDPLVKEYYETGTIDTTRMRSIDAVQPHCPTCSARQGADMSRYSQQVKKELGIE